MELDQKLDKQRKQFGLLKYVAPGTMGNTLGPITGNFDSTLSQKRSGQTTRYQTIGKEANTAYGTNSLGKSGRNTVLDGKTIALNASTIVPGSKKQSVLGLPNASQSQPLSMASTKKRAIYGSQEAMPKVPLDNSALKSMLPNISK